MEILVARLHTAKFIMHSNLKVAINCLKKIIIIKKKI